MYCDELEFGFSDLVDDGTKEILELFTADEWKGLGEEGRYELISKLTEAIGESLGLEIIPDIELVDIDDNCSGY